MYPKILDFSSCQYTRGLRSGCVELGMTIYTENKIQQDLQLLTKDTYILTKSAECHAPGSPCTIQQGH